ncbi:toll/interleukin-1 receptor domain-containing protein [Bradyrhizobium sp. Bra78]|uniref:toll/interleukin-1 receptor domain-containing protein n=1 Tax=Bradyrhizobium sp. Bra78 TaxID=2926010 RepID=UPI0039674C19
MPIPLRTLRQAALASAPVRKSLRGARAQKERTAFLCHSTKDNDLARGLVNLLQDSEWQVYVDYEDAALPERPDRETARKLRDAIHASNYFIFLATPNSVRSRWCPWEIGFADGCKNERLQERKRNLGCANHRERNGIRKRISGPISKLGHFQSRRPSRLGTPQDRRTFGQGPITPLG